MSEAGDLTTATWLAAAGGREALRLRRCRLEVVAGPDAGLRRDFAAPSLVIGRAGADLVLTDRRVSGLHAEIRLEAAGYRLRDLGSTNGTWVRGVRIVEGLLSPGAVLSLGESAVRFSPLEDSVGLPLSPERQLCGLVGASAVMRELFERLDRVAATDSTVLLTGETGTGKELAAEALHERSPRARGPFVVLDCGAVAPHLFEDELFGHAAGAFTGAGRARAGLFAAASGGTLFLDEIGELPLGLQPKLLRAVETRRVRPIGAGGAGGAGGYVECDVRLVCATSRDLAAETNRGNFRADLYHRLAVVRLHLPPLRERREDLPLLCAHFLAALPGAPAALPPAFLDWASRHPFPGNVRELRNAVERAVAAGVAGSEDERAASLQAEAPAAVDLSVPFKEAKRRLVEDFDRRYLGALLAAHGGNVSAAARAAGVDRMSIYKLMARSGRGDEG